MTSLAKVVFDSQGCAEQRVPSVIDSISGIDAQVFTDTVDHCSSIMSNSVSKGRRDLKVFMGLYVTMLVLPLGVGFLVFVVGFLGEALSSKVFAMIGLFLILFSMSWIFVGYFFMMFLNERKKTIMASAMQKIDQFLESENEQKYISQGIQLLLNCDVQLDIDYAPDGTVIAQKNIDRVFIDILATTSRGYDEMSTQVPSHHHYPPSNQRTSPSSQYYSGAGGTFVQLNDDI